MANTIRHKRSSTPSAVPSSGSLVTGELAVNTADGRVFAKKEDGTVVDVGRINATGTADNTTYLRGDLTWATVSGGSGSIADGYVYDCGEYSATTITITAQPTNQTASSGSATFSVTATATNSATITYQWQRKANGTGSWADISGATSSTLSLTGLAASNMGDYYQCIVYATGAISAIVSDFAILTVPSRIVITSQPTNQSTSGTTATFSVTASLSSGTGTIVYNWFRQAQGVGSYSFITGATSSTLSLTGLSAASNNGDKYICEMYLSGEVGMNSNIVTLTVTSGSETAAFYSPNTAWSAAGFGAGTYGTSTSKYLASSSPSPPAADGMTIRAVANGTVYITADSIGTDNQLIIAKSSNLGTSWTEQVNYGDYNGYFATSFSTSFAVASGDTIIIGKKTDSSGSTIDVNISYTNLRVWWQ